MNAPLRRLAVVTALLFASLLVSTTWIQFFAASSIADGPGNSRQVFKEYGRNRGAIVADGGATILASSTPVDDPYKFQRSYADGPLYAPATGFYSIIYGSSGVENGENDILNGTADQLFYRRLQDLLTNRPPAGGSVEVTLNSRVQQAAWDALGDQRGAVVALEPSTGRILAMVSKPSYDPNTLASHDGTAVRSAWEALEAEPTQPRGNRAIGTLYPPGSVFKIVTAAAALSDGVANPDTLIDSPAVLDLPQTSTGLPNDDGRACGNGQTTLADALRVSCNTAFGNLGLQLGGDRLVEEAKAFGFGAELEIPQRVATSVVAEGMNPPQSAQSAIGQFSDRVTPIQVAMIASAVANNGVLMRPQLVETVRAPDTTVISTFNPDEFGRAVSPEVADQLTAMMELVVASGTGTRAAIDGVRVAGKTGTAQTGVEGEAPHAWFASFAPADDPRVAVAVVVENGGTAGNEASGGRVAAPIARAVIEAVLAG